MNTESAATITDEERYLLDLNGFVVRKQALDARTVRDLTADVRATDPSTGAFGIPWTSRRSRDLIAHPAAMGVVQWLCGEAVRLDHAYGLRATRTDPRPLTLHGSAGFPADTYRWHAFGKVVSGTVVAEWVLTDQLDGGFCCVPGSHKANFSLPDSLNRLDFAQQIPLEAGDLLIFTEALTHGSAPWTAPHDRLALLLKYSPGSVAYVRPEQIREELEPYTGDDERIRVLLEPAYWHDRWPGRY
jgi:hypothetical protein